MVHCNNCTSGQSTAWIGPAAGDPWACSAATCRSGEVFTKLYQKSLEGEGRLRRRAGVSLHGRREGYHPTWTRARPLVVRRAGTVHFSLARLHGQQRSMRKIATMRLGDGHPGRGAGEESCSMDATGGIFKTPGVAQRYLACRLQRLHHLHGRPPERRPLWHRPAGRLYGRAPLPPGGVACAQRVLCPTPRITTAQPDLAEVEGFARYLWPPF